MDTIKDYLTIAKDLLDIIVLVLTAHQLVQTKRKKKSKSKRRK